MLYTLRRQLVAVEAGTGNLLFRRKHCPPRLIPLFRPEARASRSFIAGVSHPLLLARPVGSGIVLFGSGTVLVVAAQSWW